MQFSKPTAETFVPDGASLEDAIQRTTHLGIGAHHDDLEIMCMDGILVGFGNTKNWFTGITVSDGAGSARTSIYGDFSDEQMKAVRKLEQRKAAVVGEYSAVISLDYSTDEVKSPRSEALSNDLIHILRVAGPKVVYTHNLADKHPTHVAVAMNVIRAIRSLPLESRPAKLYGCEVWRALDWLMDEDKVAFALRHRDNIAAALIEVFDSQIAGGKRYDHAAMGRRRANATYHQPHSIDAAQFVDFAMDLTPLIENEYLDISSYVMSFIDRFSESVKQGLSIYL